MAVGVALLFNIKLPLNFNSPYKSTNIREFWKRWHITLSRFLRDYVYIPIGGNKVGSLRLYSNLLITFIIGGLWHGAGWTFLFWGFLHAFAIILHRFWSRFGFNLNIFIAWLLTFNFLNISWIFFRADKWEDALKVVKGMFGFSNIILPNFFQDVSFFQGTKIIFGDIYTNFDSEISIWIVAAFCISLLFKNTSQIINTSELNSKTVFYIVFLFLVSIMHFEKNVDFIYFNF